MSHLKMKKRVRNADNLMLKIINKILAVAVYLSISCLALHSVHVYGLNKQIRTQTQHLAFNWIREINPICPAV